MITNIEVAKSGNENNTGLIRRFSRKVKESGLVQRMKKSRYHERDKSEAIIQKQALRRIARGKEIKRLIKLGKLQPRTAGKNKR